MKIQIKDIRKIEKNSLRGFFTLQVADFCIKDFTFHRHGGKSWVNAPARQYKDEEGETKYAAIVFIEDKDRYAAFQKWAVGECEKLFASASEPKGAKPKDDFPF